MKEMVNFMFLSSYPHGINHPKRLLKNQKQNKMKNQLLGLLFLTLVLSMASCTIPTPAEKIKEEQNLKEAHMFHIEDSLRKEYHIPVPDNFYYSYQRYDYLKENPIQVLLLCILVDVYYSDNEIVYKVNPAIGAFSELNYIIKPIKIEDKDLLKRLMESYPKTETKGFDPPNFNLNLFGCIFVVKLTGIPEIFPDKYNDKISVDAELIKIINVDMSYYNGLPSN
jgi:hypothetical protein